MEYSLYINDNEITQDTRFQDMKDSDSEYRTILNSLLKIFEYEFARFDRISLRHQKLKKRCIRYKEMIPSLEKDTKSINVIIAKQNQIFHLCLEILNRLGFLDDRFHDQGIEEMP